MEARSQLRHRPTSLAELDHFRTIGALLLTCAGTHASGSNSAAYACMSSVTDFGRWSAV
jgi:hypothetical protein